MRNVLALVLAVEAEVAVGVRVVVVGQEVQEVLVQEVETQLPQGITDKTLYVICQGHDEGRRNHL